MYTWTTYRTLKIRKLTYTNILIKQQFIYCTLFEEFFLISIFNRLRTYYQCLEALRLKL